MTPRTLARAPLSTRRALARSLNVQRWRPVSCSAALASGHSRWSKIKHDKGKNDKLKSQARNGLVHSIFLESKYGGPDPNLNSKLAIAIANAKRGQLAKDTIEAAIAKGQGKSVSGAALENVTVECMLPHGVAAIVEYQTDQKQRVLQEARVILGKNGGTVTPTAYMFEKKGRICFHQQDKLGEDEVLEEAIEAGATEVSTEEGKIVVETAPEDVSRVAEMLKRTLKLEIESAEIIFDPNEDSLVGLSEQQDANLQRIVDLIEDEPCFQTMYLNASNA